MTYIKIKSLQSRGDYKIIPYLQYTIYPPKINIILFMRCLYLFTDLFYKIKLKNNLFTFFIFDINILFFYFCIYIDVLSGSQVQISD